MMIRFLGTHNAESRSTGLVSLLIDDVLAVDAGSLVSELTFPEQKKIKAIRTSAAPAIKRIVIFAGSAKRTSQAGIDGLGCSGESISSRACLTASICSAVTYG